MASTRPSRAKPASFASLIASGKAKRSPSQASSPVSPARVMHSTRPKSHTVSSRTAGFKREKNDTFPPSRIPSLIGAQHPQEVQTAPSRHNKSFSSGKRWSEEEDQLLCELGGMGESFKVISERLPGRSEAACTARYRDVLGSANWSEYEEQTIISLVQAGAIFQQISEQLPDRSPTQCRYRWELLKARAKRTLSEDDYSLFVSRQAGYDDAMAVHAAARRTTARESALSHSAWTDHEIGVLLSLRAHGKTWHQISKRLRGRTPGACKSSFRRYCPLEDSRTLAGYTNQSISKDAMPLQEQHLCTHFEDEEPGRDDPWTEASELTPSYDAEDSSLGSTIVKVSDDEDEANSSEDGYGDNSGIESMESDCKDQVANSAMEGAEKRSWTEREIDVLLSLRARGKTWEEISQKFHGRTAKACEMQYFWCRRLRTMSLNRQTQGNGIPPIQTSKIRAWRPEDEGQDLLTGLPCGAEGPDANAVHDTIDKDMDASDIDDLGGDDKTDYLNIRSRHTNTHRCSAPDPPTTKDDKETDTLSTSQAHPTRPTHYTSPTQHTPYEHSDIDYDADLDTDWENDRANHHGATSNTSPSLHSNNASDKREPAATKTPIIPESRLVPFARRVLHDYLVAQGQEKIKRNMLQRTQISHNHPVAQEQEQKSTNIRHHALEELKRTHPPQAQHGETTLQQPAGKRRRLVHGYERDAVSAAKQSPPTTQANQRVISNEDRQLRAQRDALRGHLRAMEDILDRHKGMDMDGLVGVESEGGEEDVEGVYRQWSIR